MAKQDEFTTIVKYNISFEILYPGRKTFCEEREICGGPCAWYYGDKSTYYPGTAEYEPHIINEPDDELLLTGRCTEIPTSIRDENGKLIGEEVKCSCIF